MGFGIFSTGILHLSWRTFKEMWKWKHFSPDKISSTSDILSLQCTQLVFCSVLYSSPVIFQRPSNRPCPPFSPLSTSFLTHFPTLSSLTAITHLTSSLQVSHLSHFPYLCISFFHCFSNPDTSSYVSLPNLLLSFQFFNSPQISLPGISLPPSHLSRISYLFCFAFSPHWVQSIFLPNSQAHVGKWNLFTIIVPIPLSLLFGRGTFFFCF